jgi:hypothetical protein
MNRVSKLSLACAKLIKPHHGFILLIYIILLSMMIGCDSNSDDTKAESMIMDSSDPILAGMMEAGTMADSMEAGTMQMSAGMQMNAGTQADTTSNDMFVEMIDMDVPKAGLAVLGYQQHTMEAVNSKVLLNEEDGLNTPRDLAVNPIRPNELWVINQRDDSMIVLFDYDSEAQQKRKFRDPFALHFMEEPSSLSFADNGLFATCQESNNTYNQSAPPDDFMGPALWTSDFDIFARTNPIAVNQLGDDLGSHLDMLHESPFCMGITWEKDNIYWIFEGQSESIARVDFREDHGPGFDDHSDGITWRYGIGQVKRMPQIVSHLVYDAESQLLYIADTGNQRIAVLNTAVGGEMLSAQPVMEPGTQLWNVEDGAEIETFAETAGMFRGAAGLVLHQNILYVGDASNGRITALDVNSGEVLDWLDTGIASPGLAGMFIDEQGRLLVLDKKDNQLIRIQAKE